MGCPGPNPRMSSWRLFLGTVSARLSPVGKPLVEDEFLGATAVAFRIGQERAPGGSGQAQDLREEADDGVGGHEMRDNGASRHWLGDGVASLAVAQPN